MISGVRNAAVAHLTKTLSGQLGPYGITVNTIHPGTVRTERTDEMYEEEADTQGISKEEVAQRAAEVQSIGRIVESAEIAHLVCFLASPKAAAITGEVIAVDGGGARRCSSRAGQRVQGIRVNCSWIPASQRPGLGSNQALLRLRPRQIEGKGRQRGPRYGHLPEWYVYDHGRIALKRLGYHRLQVQRILCPHPDHPE